MTRDEKEKTKLLVEKEKQQTKEIVEKSKTDENSKKWVSECGALHGTRKSGRYVFVRQIEIPLNQQEDYPMYTIQKKWKINKEYVAVHLSRKKLTG